MSKIIKLKDQLIISVVNTITIVVLLFIVGFLGTIVFPSLGLPTLVGFIIPWVVIGMILRLLVKAAFILIGIDGDGD